MTRLFLIDDHVLFRKALRQLVSTMPSMEVVGEASNGPEAFAQLHTLRADVVLLDISLKDGDGFDVASRLASEHPELPVLMLSMHNEAPIVSRAVRQGVAGYVTKDCPPETLQSAISKVASGGRFIDPTLVDMLIFAEQSAEPRFEALSDREFQVLKLLVDGMQPSQIAEALSLSIKTVSTHKTRLMKKLDAHSTADLMRLAIRHGLVPA